MATIGKIEKFIESTEKGKGSNLVSKMVITPEQYKKELLPDLAELGLLEAGKRIVEEFRKFNENS